MVCAMVGVEIAITIVLPKIVAMTMEATIVITNAWATAIGIALSIECSMVIAFAIPDTVVMIVTYSIAIRIAIKTCVSNAIALRRDRHIASANTFVKI